LYIVDFRAMLVCLDYQGSMVETVKQGREG